jgi:hypothetical protein
MLHPIDTIGFSIPFVVDRLSNSVRRPDNAYPPVGRADNQKLLDSHKA